MQKRAIEVIPEVRDPYNICIVMKNARKVASVHEQYG